jgi:hypothetical protein
MSLFAESLFGQAEEKSPGEDGSLLARLLQRPCGEGISSTLKLFYSPHCLLHLLRPNSQQHITKWSILLLRRTSASKY